MGIFYIATGVNALLSTLMWWKYGVMLLLGDESDFNLPFLKSEQQVKGRHITVGIFIFLPQIFVIVRNLSQESITIDGLVGSILLVVGIFLLRYWIYTSAKLSIQLIGIYWLFSWFGSWFILVRAIRVLGG